MTRLGPVRSGRAGESRNALRGAEDQLATQDLAEPEHPAIEVPAAAEPAPHHEVVVAGIDAESGRELMGTRPETSATPSVACPDDNAIANDDLESREVGRLVH